MPDRRTVCGYVWPGLGGMAVAMLAVLASPNSPAKAGPLAEDLQQALAIDAEYIALTGRRSAVASRRATIDGIIAGSPSAGASALGNRFGANDGREFEVELTAPVWLPGQRGVVRQAIDAEVGDAEGRLLRRRLDVAGALREARWDVEIALREAALARDRAATARDLERDVRRRSELGELARGDVLLAENERLQSESELVRLEQQAAALRLAYATLTNGATPDSSIEPERDPVALEQHPLILAAIQASDAARARRREVETLSRDNPEVGVFGRSTTDAIGTSQAVGGKLRFPFATEARNVPRLAAADAEIVRAVAEGEKVRRDIEAETRRALGEIAATRRELDLAAQRLAVATEQQNLARRSFDLGESGLFEFLRARQIFIDARRGQAVSDVAHARARARLNQAYGQMP